MGDRPDVRARPDRGVKVDPLPKFMHQRFSEFCQGMRALCNSHIGTYQHALREGVDETYVRSQLIYWMSARKFINHIEYMGTHHDSPKRR